jgi:CheY-like chemotaxis protein
MPIMDGIEACTVINGRNVEDGCHPIAKVVFVTAHAMNTVESKCAEAGGVDFVTKPCSLQSIDDCFKRVLSTTAAEEWQILMKRRPEVSTRHAKSEACISAITCTLEFILWMIIQLDLHRLWSKTSTVDITKQHAVVLPVLYRNDCVHSF